MTVFKDRKPGFGAENGARKAGPGCLPGVSRTAIPAGRGVRGTRRSRGGAKRPSRYPHGMRCETTGREAES